MPFGIHMQFSANFNLWALCRLASICSSL